jgi:four helix bundle protein
LESLGCEARVRRRKETLVSTASYRKLEVWAKAMDVAERIYAMAREMPRQEEYRITSQLIRAAISIPANIAEGHARGTRKEYSHFISIARGSAAELETLARAEFVAEGRGASLLAEVERVSRMLNRLHHRLKHPASA